MNCPVCNNVRMREFEKMGVMIDICPDCKGVWLDRGELDKLMSGIREVNQESNEHRKSDHYNDDDRNHHDDHDDHDRNNHKKKKKTTVLDVFGDLFG
ncbi:zf-TFIIB domain-containing protein [Cohnella silvisoli]|uniref:Zf-TFIIB domain-containing protein n=1 Tax=Cohnella silvisoli TaxID=2873699 RepID=A0ABV1KY87_9BACL|nr:zf-TFIIB domain-containing protein [Cohnella silvisoli]MCD9026521.1 zf-TFIIB domain-containing protein [Cohnella silvisoli]